LGKEGRPGSGKVGELFRGLATVEMTKLGQDEELQSSLSTLRRGLVVAVRAMRKKGEERWRARG
jgi:hypothetical protein